ncbi:MAG TPA: hypothetical protein VK393_02625 [Nocardioidaceae bacterium]|jgi:hypothetical protein|nr:hypothetical protein [Nocardioidaceae bacterium]
MQAKAPGSRRLRGAVAALGLLLAAGCGANFDAQTNKIYQPAAGVNDQEGQVHAFNVLVVHSEGRGTLIGALLNKAARSDALVAVTGRSDSSDLTAEIAGSQLDLPPDQLAQIGDDGAVSISGEGLTLGASVEITLRFQNAGPVTVEVPVVARTGDYATVPVR